MKAKTKQTPELVVYKNIVLSGVLDTPSFQEFETKFLFGSIRLLDMVAGDAIDIQLRLSYPTSNISVNFNSFPQITANGLYNFVIGSSNHQIDNQIFHVVNFTLPAIFLFRFIPTVATPVLLSFGFQTK